MLSLGSFFLVAQANAGPYEIAMDSDGRSSKGDWFTGLIVAGAVIYALVFGDTKLKIIIGLGVVAPFALMFATDNPAWMFGIYIFPFIVAAIVDKFYGQDTSDKLKDRD